MSSPPSSAGEQIWFRTKEGAGPNYDEWLGARREELLCNPFGVRAPDVTIAHVRIKGHDRFLYDTMTSAPSRSLAELESHAIGVAARDDWPGKLISLDYHSAATDASGDVVVSVTPRFLRAPSVTERLYLPAGFCAVSPDARAAIEATIGDDACERELELALEREDEKAIARLQKEAHRRWLSTMRMWPRLAERGFRKLALRGIRHHLSLLPDDEEAKNALANLKAG